MLEPPCAPSSDDPFRSGDPRLYPIDFGRCSLFFQLRPPPDWISAVASWRSCAILSRVN
ncbi:hypothetical protein SLEP1_g41082 [Rubroshorea leprosula]|uniref:Uncharacterized protein n=1 Tax=Rubroshorea leprosula TaxID=152421 RepID=A0AAV5L5K8_9ROSI|nr:hypothetical protein SLEP1_g41082 [Rubroshorea leprosula]